MRFLLLTMVFLSACGGDDAKELREPGAEGPVKISVWDLESGRVTRVTAASIDMAGDQLNEFVLHQPQICMPLKNGYLLLSTDEALLEQGRVEQLHIERIVHLQGVVDGKPLRGTAEGLSTDNSARNCTLHQAAFTWGKQQVTVGQLELEQGGVLKGKDWHEEPLADGVDEVE